ncbi:MAG: DUF1624 domain-containing protein [Saprospiraceae bacterium]|nr:DUF1624 domain-containing protein [Saprospiraceae bacterium]
MTNSTTNRIDSIDMVRGLAMAIMALDHVRDYFHVAANTDDPLNLQTTTVVLFFTRWVTHFCAPIFVFLSGTSIYLQSQRKTSAELATFLIKRGFWLIFAEWFIVSLAWTFNPAYALIPFQVIWAIGISMVILGIVVWFKFPLRFIFIIGLILVAGHNLLDIPETTPGFSAGFWWDLFHHGYFMPYEILDGHSALLVYAFPVWLGVMMLGYCAGVWFKAEVSRPQRRTWLLRAGLGAIVFFAILRYSNVYGDPVDWSVQRDGMKTLLSFLNVDKYPASLLYLCITLGPSFILLAIMEGLQNKFTGILTTFGRTAFFYYIVHLYLIHFLSMLTFFYRGHTYADAYNENNHFPFLYVVPGEGYSLPAVYLIWAFVLIIMYPLCWKYDQYKVNNREKWWLSYL